MAGEAEKELEHRKAVENRLGINMFLNADPPCMLTFRQDLGGMEQVTALRALAMRMTMWADKREKELAPQAAPPPSEAPFGPGG